jgi:hypothetical protein
LLLFAVDRFPLPPAPFGLDAAGFAWTLRDVRWVGWGLALLGMRYSSLVIGVEPPLAALWANCKIARSVSSDIRASGGGAVVETKGTLGRASRFSVTAASASQTCS